jgi:hypothetical protein
MRRVANSTEKYKAIDLLRQDSKIVFESFFKSQKDKLSSHIQMRSEKIGGSITFFIGNPNFKKPGFFKSRYLAR